MELKKYHYINIKKNNNKNLHSNNSDNSAGTKIVIRKDSTENYEFLFFPVNPIYTSDNHDHYIVHAESGLVLGVDGGSSKEKKKIVLAKVSGKYDQHWTFENRDKEGNFTIINRLSGYACKIENGHTDNGTNIIQGKLDKSKDSFYFNCKELSKSIPKPSLVGYINRYTENKTNDINLIPEAAKDSSSYNDTSPVIIGECGIPYFMVSSDSNRPLGLQVEETPYYLLRRTQYWKFLDNINIPAGATHDEGFTYTYGASKTVTEEFNTISDWELSVDLGVLYNGVSAGVSGSISQSMEMKSSSSTTDYSEITEDINTAYGVTDYDRVYSFWQIVDVIELFDGDNNEIKRMEIPGKATYTTCYNDK